MGFDHVEFVVNGVKLSFYAAPRKALSAMKPIQYQNNLRIADFIATLIHLSLVQYPAGFAALFI